MYYIKYDNDNGNDISIDYNKVIDAKHMNFMNISSSKDIDLLVSIQENKKILKKYIRKFMKYRKRLARKDTCNIYIKNYTESPLQKEFIRILESIFLVDLKQIYNNVYDIACDYLDNQFQGKNLCDFCDNKCGYKKETDIEVGCCMHFAKHKQFGGMFGEKLVACENLGADGKCTIKCMGCKLFTCSYLEKKGIRFKTTEIFAIDSIFNWVQKIFLKAIVYTPKEKMIDIMLFLHS